jgi:hypothetical protein
MTSTEAVIKNPAAEGTTSAFSLIFELEGAAIDGHTVLFEAAKSVFQKAGVTLTDLQVARYCTHGAIPQIIQKLVDELGNGKLGADAANQILAAYHDGFKTASRVHPLFASFLKETNRRGIRATAISILPEEIAQQVLASSGLADQGVDLHVFVEAERHFPRVDCWMKVVPPGRQVAPRLHRHRRLPRLRQVRPFVRHALRHHARPFTGHQDFSGADAVLESADDYSLTELIDQLT